MALSTGFDETKVLAALTGRIGWVNPTQDDYDIVDEANQASTSGRYFNDGSFHSSCTIQNLKDTQEDDQISDEEFNTLLTNLKRSTILSCVNSVFDKIEAIESGLIYQRSNVPASFEPEYINNTGKFCGIRINIGQGNYAVVIDSLTLLLDSAKTLNIYIYKDFKNAPLATIPITTVANEETSVSVARVLNHLSSENKGGAYYIGYYQDDLGDARAIDCSPCVNQFRVFGFCSLEATTNDATGFDKFNYSANYKTYGINLEMSSYYDYTDAIVKAAHQFDEYIGLSMAAKVIERVVVNNRINDTAVQAGSNVSKLYDELNIEPANAQGMPLSPGIKSRLRKELKRLQAFFHQKDKSITVSIC